MVSQIQAPKYKTYSFEIDGLTSLAMDREKKQLAFFFATADHINKFVDKMINDFGHLLYPICEPLSVNQKFCLLTIKDNLPEGFKEATLHHLFFYISAAYWPDKGAKALHYKLPTE
jgi:hypothetical protein